MRWTFAKTMPEWPREYIVRERVDEELFVQLVVHIRTNGYEGKFYRRDITYCDDGGLTYWTMGAPIEETIIINRCRQEDTYEQRRLNGALPGPKGVEAEKAGTIPNQNQLSTRPVLGLTYAGGGAYAPTPPDLRGRTAHRLPS